MGESCPGKFTQGAYRLSEQWPYLRFLGIGLWVAWIWLCYAGTSLFVNFPESNDVAYAGVMYLCSTPAIALALVGAAIAWRSVTPMLQNRLLVVGVSLLALVGVLLIAYSPYIGGDAVFYVGAVLTGLGTSVLCLKTGELLGSIGIRESLTVGCVSLMLAAFVYFMGQGIPQGLQPAFIASLPLFSVVLLVMPNDDPFSGEVRAEDYGVRQSRGKRAYFNLTVAMVMVASTASFGKGLVSATGDAQMFAEAGAIITLSVFFLSVAVCVAVNFGETYPAVRLVYAVLIVLGVVMALSSWFGVSLIYLGIGKELLWMMLVCFTAYLVFKFDLSPIRAFGLGMAVYFISSAISWWAGILCADWLSGAGSLSLVAGVMVLTIVIVYAFVFNDSDLKFILMWSARDDLASEADASPAQVPAQVAESDEAAPTVSDAAVEPCSSSDRELSLHERIALIDPSFGVSEREREIMELFAQGRSAVWIAEELFISRNTVRSHLRSVYTKLDVHTRQELIDFLKTIH